MKHKVTGKGQVTIPKEIREHLRIKGGDYVKIFAHPNGSAVILGVRPITELRGLLKSSRRVTIEEMNDGIAEGALASMGRGFRVGTPARRLSKGAKR
jgi:AbrB family looped-hinge helix DNA binding protein